VGFLDVYRNGVRLGASNFTATNGTTVVLGTACNAGDLVTIVFFTLVSVANAMPQSGGTFTGNIAVPTGTLYPLVSDAAKSATSTSVDFTGIPSWVKRITVMFNGVSTNGTSSPLIQLGTSTGVTTSGYLAGSTESGTGRIAYSTGFGLASGNISNLLYQHIFITNVSGNIWLATHSGNFSQSGVYYSLVGGGNVTLSNTLDRVRITTVNGTDTFDAGTINIMWE
jgi:hypothetical protein